jgi:hypothetical protein
LYQDSLVQAAPPLGEGLLNTLQAYSAEEDYVGILSQPDTPGPSLVPSATQELDHMEESLFLPDNVQLVPPNEAHLQLTLGRVHTHFFPIPEEHDLTRRFSTTGLLLWEKYFSPHLHGSGITNNSSLVDIHVSWFNFITLMLLTPEKFDWAKSFLSSQLWDILKEPMNSEATVQFVIPGTCATSKAPLCIALSDQDEGNSPPIST